MPNTNYSYNPSINPWSKEHLLYEEESIYAKLSLKKLFKSSAKYESNFLRIFIEANTNNLFITKSYSLYQLVEKNKKIVAAYEFISLKDLPVGFIKLVSGEEYAIIKYDDNCYDVRLKGVFIAKFETIVHRNFLKPRTLNITMKKSEEQGHELVIFAVWYMMIIVGMGLNDG